jgi:hypothetical protein
MFAAITTKTFTFTQSFDGWPDWAVIALATVVLALAIWIAIKLMKWALWILFFVVLLGGFGWALWSLVG